MLYRSFFALYIVWGIYSSAFSQASIAFHIVDQASQSPVSYARIFNVSKSVGTVSDEKGYGKLTKTQPSDSILISAIGYQDMIIVCTKDVENIELITKTYVLNEVVIRASAHKKNRKTPSKLKASGGLCEYYDKGHQLVTFISGKSSKNNLQKASVYINKKIDCLGKIRLVLYSIDSAGLPGTDVLSTSIVRDIQGLHGWATFDLKNLNIKIPENGAFAGIELVDFAEERKEKICLGLSDQMEENDTWMKSIGGEWYQLPFMKSRKGRPFNIMVRVE